MVPPIHPSHPPGGRFGQSLPAAQAPRGKIATVLDRFLTLARLVALLVCATSASAQPVKTSNVEAELVAERAALVPGQKNTLALRLSIRDRWHTYWQNPGDSGLPTTLEWKLPGGLAAGAIQWPAPKMLRAGPLVNYGYEGEVLHLVDVDVPATFTATVPLTLAARADWLVCEDICIPEGADLAITLPIDADAAPSAKWGARIAQTRDALPKPLAGWQAQANGEGAIVKLTLTPTSNAAAPGTLRFFPYREGAIEPSAPQTVARDGDRYVLTLPVAHQLVPGFTRVAGVITASNGIGGANAATLDVPLTGSIVAGPKPLDPPPPTLNARGTSSLSLVAAIALALLGGVLLNLMPCVFPVLSLKILGFVEHRDAKRTLQSEAIAYGAGVVLSFIALALALIALRAAGEQLGWGFQLQSPIVITALALLFFVLALNLSGVFEFGMLAPSSIAARRSRNRTADAFGSGVLAVVVASPCTAPFMGAALGYAISQSIPVTLAVFVALGVGMALPYMLLAWFPRWRNRLPRPGPWMARIKNLLAFPLYATVAWLAWVLGAQVGNDAVLRLAFALVCVAFAAWAWRLFRSGAARGFAIAALVGVVAIALLLAPIATGSQSTGAARNVTARDSVWQPFSPTTVAALTASGRPVFVDFTAAWCVTCQVNKRLVLNTDGVRAAFAAKNVALVRADWTRRDPDITRALAALGRNGVPVYVLYRPGKDPLLLPEVLQAGAVHDALATL
ncbi:MAG TPA: thioredoxin family protein [Casimicrobiaceae bacterium]|nr:thioredoxin family protein [Casimicrobiaceae bacterium]